MDMTRSVRPHPLQAMLVAFPVPLFLGALLSDWAYSSTYQVQWLNFATWLVPGALVFTGFALAWSLVDSLRTDRARGWSRWLLTLLLATTFVVGFINALVHAKDGWATMPEALILSVIVLILAIASAWAAFWPGRTGERR